MVRRARRSFVTLVVTLVVFLTIQGHAAVSAQLSETRIGELETVRLTIRASETRQTQNLDLTALEADFHVMGTNTSSQYRYRNGREQSWVDYQITLQPKRTGTLHIPPINVGRAQTPPLTLDVRPLAASTRQAIDELVFFESSVSSVSIYVQSQVLLTRRLFYSQGVQLYSDLPGAPELPDAVVLTIGETKSATVERGDRVYGVVEQNYAIFPEASGILDIPSIGVTASVRLRENGRLARKGVRVETQDLSVRVKPVPAEFPASAAWLPAENVQLLQVIDESRADVGDTLTHELLIHMDGNVGSMAPALALSLPDADFRTYPEAPVIKDDTNSDVIKGSRLQTSAVVPQRPGMLTIPSVRLPWWDTKNDALRYAEVPALHLTIAGQAVQRTLPAPSQSESDAAVAEPSTDATPVDLSWLANYTYLLWWLAALLIALAGFGWARRNDWWRSDALKARHARADAVATARAEFDEVMAGGELTAIYPALMRLAQVLWELPPGAAVDAMRAADPEIASALDRLQAHLYRGETSDAPPDLRALQRAGELQRDVAPKAASGDSLPPLYPSQA